MSVQIVEVTTKQQLRRFVDYPNQLYKDVPQFVPAFYGDDMADWDKDKNPAFEYSEARMFMAMRGDEMVGRIAAILNHRANEKFHTKRMRFSQVDFIDDAEVSSALFDAVESWAKERGCTEVHGPLGFCDLDREGMLVEGYDKRSMFITYYNHPYYNEHLERLGYGKDVDWVEMMIPVPQPGTRTYEKISRVSEFILRKGKYHKAVLKNRAAYKPFIRKAFELVNVAYGPLYGTVELTEGQVKKYADKFVPLIDPDFCCMVLDEKDDLVAFGVGAPSMATAMQKSRGRLFPTGWIGVLKSLRKSDALDLFLIAVRPDLQGTGINAVIMDHLTKGCNKRGILEAETGPQLELNEKILGQWKMFELTPHKRRRCYVKSIAEEAAGTTGGADIG